MTESTDTITNYNPSDCDNDDYPINVLVEAIDQQEYINDEFSLFYNDHDDEEKEDNLTLFEVNLPFLNNVTFYIDLKAVAKLDHDLSIFDELAYQCDAVLLATNDPQKSTLATSTINSYSLKPMAKTMINDYERRFQRSLQKLSIPSWYNEPIPSPKLTSKATILSTNHYNQEPHRTPEIVHVHRPHSYRSCRSSLGTSPSPSAHSWHPNYLHDGMNFSPLLPSSSSSSHRSNKYEKGIERVTKSSRWYQPTQFVVQKTSNPISISKVPTTIRSNRLHDHHYDIPKFHVKDNLENRRKQNPIPKLSLQRQANCLIDGIDFDDVENTNINPQHNNYDKSNIALTYDKQQDNRIRSNEIALMPLANENISFARVELEEVTDEDENDNPLPRKNMRIPSNVEEEYDDKSNTSLECVASRLVESILADVLLMQNLTPDDDNNTGVRELSDDENALRELDENDMSGTDEFILFATKAEVSDDEEEEDEEKKNIQNENSVSPTVNRGSLNRLYTFTRTNDDGAINNNSKKLLSNQDSSTSLLMIVDKDISPTNSHSNPDANQIGYFEHDQTANSPPIYRSHIQKRHINLGRYYDGMMRAKSSQLPTHDLRCNLALHEPKSSEGVTEETVRKGRILLDQIPDSLELKNQVNEPTTDTPIRSILKNARFALANDTEDQNSEDQKLKIEENDKILSRKIITTITEEYHRIQRKIIEEFDTEYRDSDNSNNRESLSTQQLLTPAVARNDSSPYELLSECYSGYSLMRNKLSIPVKTPPTSNLSSLQSTTDEAYESETTISPRSPTISSSTAATNTTTTVAHVHPDLEHEFEYPSPPPPVPDRRLKPAHLRPPPPTKPRSHKPSGDSVVYSKIEKPTKTSPLTSIQHLLASSPTDPDSSSTRALSSRHYCGSLPLSYEPTSSSSDAPVKLRTDENSDRNSKIRSVSTHETQSIKFKKSSSSSFNKSKSKKSSTSYFDEATNGLAIRLPANPSTEQDSTNKQNLNRTSTKRTDGPTKHRPASENLNSDRSSTYETSV